MSSREKLVPITVRLPKRVHAELVKIARRNHGSLNRELVVAAEQYVEQPR